MRKKIQQIYVEKFLFSLLSYWLFVTFLPKKQRLSPAKNFNSWVFVMKINHCNSQSSWLRLQWTFPHKTTSVPASEGARLTGGHRGNTFKTHRCHHHDMYHFASLGATAPALHVNSRQFVFKAEMLCSLWITIGGQLANRRSGVYASSPLWMGLLFLELG